jgi:hypothetical protein
VSKPRTVAEYAPEQLRAVRAACVDFTLAAGELLNDVVIVGGLAPSLLIDSEHSGGEAHVGTMDLDVGLQVGLPDRAHYHRLAARLRDRGFAPAVGQDGDARPDRWQRGPHLPPIDFLIPPLQPRSAAGSLVAVDHDLEAVVTPGLRLAFRDRERVRVDRWWPEGKGPSQGLPVCGPGAFVVLKALAFRGRHENKDAYDLHYVIRHYGSAAEDVADRLRPLQDDWDAQRAIAYLREDFASLDSAGPLAVAAFLLRPDDDGLKADVAGLVGRLTGSL